MFQMLKYFSTYLVEILSVVSLLQEYSNLGFSVILR